MSPRGPKIAPPEAAEGMNLRDYLSEPKTVARRGEVWQMILMGIRLERAQRRYNRFYNRWIRAVRGWLSKHFWPTDLSSPTEFPDIEHPEEVERDTA